MYLFKFIIQTKCLKFLKNKKKDYKKFKSEKD